MTIEIREVTYSDGSTGEQVEITAEDGSVTIMHKATWDELEAQREQSGTL